jgi:hypothetical protein
MIDRELIDYARLTATTFEVATRGAGGTTAVAHASGAPIGQDQCDLTATGGVPNAAGAQGRRQLRHGVQLQEGWAAGQATAATSFTTQNLNAVFCLPSGTECWAVGNAGAIGRWNGASWTLVASPVASTLRAVNCVAVNDCWIVGDNSGGEVILRWDGANWTRLAPAAGLPDINLRSVYCTATNNCWAVGAAWNPPGGGTPNQGAILFWNGATWTARQDLAATAAPNTQLNSVHCVDANNCWIVGNQSGGEVILRWTGGPNWTRVGPSAALPNVNLQVIACVHVSDCWAVGDTGARFHWDGTSWSSVTIPAVTSNLYGLGLIGPRARPQAGWQEVYP